MKKIIAWIIIITTALGLGSLFVFLMVTSVDARIAFAIALGLVAFFAALIWALWEVIP